MKYVEVEPIDRDEAEKLIASGDSECINFTLVRLAYHEPDWRWVEGLCLKLSTHEDWRVRAICATCFGHLARIHGELDTMQVMPVLRRLLDDALTKGYAEEAVDEIKIFLRGRGPRPQ